jgi:NAD(P)-dependent dehydrogenase (short-subunit alcohol dehydrogenase family)
MSATPSAAYSAAKARYACADQEPRDRARALQDPCERDCTRTTDLQRDPLGRNGQPADAAEVLLFLASDQASFITGVVPSVDSGVMAGRQ